MSRPGLIAIVFEDCSVKWRLEKLTILRKYLPIDVFGSGTCATHPLPPECRPGYVGKVGCHAALGAKYRFYLSLEAAECDDYISQAMWNHALQSSMVPIVWGKRQHYERHLPPSSFINVSDFPSLYAFVQHINKISNFEVMYQGYFAWKGAWTIKKGDVLMGLCEHVLRNNGAEKEPIDLVSRAAGKKVCAQWEK
jgi:hypothetical protein